MWLIFLYVIFADVSHVGGMENCSRNILQPKDSRIEAHSRDVRIYANLRCISWVVNFNAAFKFYSLFSKLPFMTFKCKYFFEEILAKKRKTKLCRPYRLCRMFEKNQQAYIEHSKLRALVCLSEKSLRSKHSSSKKKTDYPSRCVRFEVRLLQWPKKCICPVEAAVFFLVSLNRQMRTPAMMAAWKWLRTFYYPLKFCKVIYVVMSLELPELAYC